MVCLNETRLTPEPYDGVPAPRLAVSVRAREVFPTSGHDPIPRYDHVPTPFTASPELVVNLAWNADWLESRTPPQITLLAALSLPAVDRVRQGFAPCIGHRDMPCSVPPPDGCLMTYLFRHLRDI